MAFGKIVTVTGIKNGLLQIVGAGEHRSDIPIASGMDYLPKVGDKVFIMPFEDNYCCVGLITASTDIKSGEKRLESGGGYIHIKNNGDVVINGVVITKSGIIMEGKSY